MVHSIFFFAYLIMIGNIDRDFLRNHIRFLIFYRLDRVISETQPIHLIFTDLLVSIVSSIKIDALTFETEMTQPSRTGLDRFFEP